ncbi:MAG: anhydro-N-acetylmuramic acid kinase AnmK [Tenericutes bacterium]|jgi:anhydro-N-acetylmuramic acid kinase|nr:anhydro-N-acetylmuramic acid kinase AnmK [Mycoplasmatota bacterium]
MKKLAISMMSGTSLDGIDIIFGEIEGSKETTKVEILHAKTYPYEKNLLIKIKKAISLDASTSKLLCSLNYELAEAYSKCVFSFCKDFNIKMDNINFIANHGQTIYHIAEDEDDYVSSSMQLGDGSILANLTKTMVVSNFRMADIARGGNGAPLVPYANYVLFKSNQTNRILQNIGGIANLTYLEKNCKLDDVIAFDNGPGNMMIDYAMQRLYNKAYDESGLIAKSGYIIKQMFDEVINHPYFLKKPPKSTGRELFGKEYCDYLINKYNQFEKQDLVCTLTNITAYTIVKSYKTFLEGYSPLDEIIVTGGGSRNNTLLDLIRYYSKSDNVCLLEDYGYDSDYFESLAFLILANETLLGNASNVPNATGADDYVILGQISPVRR